MQIHRHRHEPGASGATTISATALLLSLLLAAGAGAQPKPGYAPSSTHIFPAGARRGTTVQVRVGTECFPPGTQFLLEAPGIHAPPRLGRQVVAPHEPSPRRAPTEIPITYPREWESQLTIEPDAPTGTVFWRLHSAQGGSAARPFVVGELPEWTETESNSLPERAERIELPVTLNGQIYGERDVDYYRFPLAAGQVVTCEVLARRLGSPLDPVVELQDGEGRTVQADQTRVGEDPVLVFRAPRDAQYLLRVANLTFHGSPACVYRVNLTTRPFARYALPGGLARGETSTVEIGLLTGDGQVQWIEQTVDAGQLETLGEPLPAGVRARYASEPFSGALPLVLEDHPARREAEPNQTVAEATEVELPVSLHGSFQDRRDVDHFSFPAQAGRSYRLTCHAAPAGAALPVLFVADENGKRLATARSVESAGGVCELEWQAPRDGPCYVGVHDQRKGAAGDRSLIYRLVLRPSQPDFAIRVDTDPLNVVQGTKSNWEIHAQRFGGFEGEITLAFDGLPDDVVAEPTIIPAGQAKLRVQLAAAENARVRTAPVRIRGRAAVAASEGEEPVVIERTARAPHPAADSERVSVGPATVDRLMLSVVHRPVFRLYCSEAYQYAHRGSVYPYLMDVERLDGFDAPIVLQIGDRQNRDLDGIEMIETVVGPQEKQAWLPIYLPESMHINIQSQSQLYCQAYAVFEDAHGQSQSVLVLAEKRNMLRTMPPVTRLTAAQTTLRARAGETRVCDLQLERTSRFTGPMQIEVAERAPGVTVTPQKIDAHAAAAQVPIRVDRPLPADGATVTLRATGQLTPQIEIVSEVRVRLLPR